jgi:WXXGXW repeat (2 copies)
LVRTDAYKIRYMKKKLGSIIIAVIVLTAASCNEHFRFIIDPIPPGIPIVIQPVSPGAGYIWIGGEWFWNGNAYTWRDGYWTRPHDRHVWSPGHWRKSRGGWFWVPGYWRR